MSRYGNRYTACRNTAQDIGHKVESQVRLELSEHAIMLAKTFTKGVIDLYKPVSDSILKQTGFGLVVQIKWTV